MIFEYQALNRKGDTVADVVDAPSEQAARQKIRGMGLYLVKLEEHGGKPSAASSASRSGIRRAYEGLRYYLDLKFSSRQVGIFSRQLSVLLGAGMPLLVAINDIIDQVDNRNFKSIVVDIKEKLEEGSSFSACLERHPIVFTEMYINMVRVGESLGSLDQVIERLAELEEKKNILKGKIQAALWYPAFLIFFAILVVLFIMINIIPSLTRMFLELGKDLPLPTRVVMGFSDFLASFWPLLLAVLAAGALFVRKYVKTPEGRRKADELKLSIPLVGNLYRKLVVLRFTQNLGVLLSNRVDIMKSFEIVKKIVVNSVIEEKIDEAADRIREGSSVSTALARADFLPRLVIGMIAAGEASDRLDAMLQNIGRVYETELDLTVTSLTSMIEPIIIIIMGVVIGLIVIAVLLPIFEMNLILQ
ncbi:MAG TPA: type II secretion system F family protein [Spirochaetota bacterium]|mgnify:FL=1|nr:type II secretion system F family protein [Spirochaetota bacterium]OPZ37233.1 MAG: Type II secretion system protein F [Spirochaetes bacterium ADurb.BinA120]HNU90866.1 type II secretion system F family protein [Spirochaetota bacterium]HPI14794.1 type II secretion system F family protein [Spirochaetota bacterium]HPV97220.1 type II secretion system F family protein [Spirochaetota bacterium]